MSIRRKASSFEEYWLASKAWERRGLTTAVAQALVHNGFLSLDDLQGAHDLELATIPGSAARAWQHCDGPRLWNFVAILRRPLSRMVLKFDTERAELAFSS